MPPPPAKYYDTLIIGAGFSGIYQLHSALTQEPKQPPQPPQKQQSQQQQPLTAHLIDEAPSVGGTWFWNRYPGALSDTESFVYRYSWDRDDLRTYPWPRRYLKQPEVRAYLEHVVRKHGLQKHMSLGVRMKGAVWDAGAGVWRVRAVKVKEKREGEEVGEEEEEEEGEEMAFVARYVVTALGFLSRKNYPRIRGMGDFRGTMCHTAAWPDDLDLRDKRVGVIGTGATGVQLITEIAGTVKSLTCFQRRAQYTVPNGDGPVSAAQRAQINRDYDAIMASLPHTRLGCGFEESTVPYESVPAAEREAVFERLWAHGNGFHFLMAGFSDISISPVANEAACDFIRKKIGEIVRDPEKARILMPTDRYARRPLCDSGYYEQFNRDNVHIVDVGAAGSPISHFTESSLVTQDGTQHELDVVIFATGFDAVDGSYSRLHIRGVGGRTLQEHWAERGATTYLGISVPNFPNLFMVMGPQSPLTNVPATAEPQARFISFLIGEAERSRKVAAAAAAGAGAGAGSEGTVIEATADGERKWIQTCQRIADGTLWKESPSSWVFGNNVSGKKEGVRLFLGGLKNYLHALDAAAENGLRGFKPLLANESDRSSDGMRNSLGKL
ncbi:hypothetical protein GX51_01051 [Blastomyces parvus]|uniref:Cyclohexanone monooxygenase n=1 Tax=Blastomyces parvus TaxID=2060905 RepID=A0A2B7XIL3_9EURO|nr:hypothetical protein GX51_01051 [Blastomyces parvus]